MMGKVEKNNKGGWSGTKVKRNGRGHGWGEGRVKRNKSEVKRNKSGVKRNNEEGGRSEP